MSTASELEFKRADEVSIPPVKLDDLKTSLNTFLPNDNKTIWVLDGDMDGFYASFFISNEYAGVLILLPKLDRHKSTDETRLVRNVSEILCLSIGRLKSNDKMRVLVILDNCLQFFGIPDYVDHLRVRLGILMNQPRVKTNLISDYVGSALHDDVFLFEQPSKAPNECHMFVKADLNHPDWKSTEGIAFLNRLSYDLTLCRGEKYLHTDVDGIVKRLHPSQNHILYLMLQNTVPNMDWWKDLRNVSSICAAIHTCIYTTEAKMKLTSVCSRPRTKGAVSRLLDFISEDAETTYHLNHLEFVPANANLEKVFQLPAYGFRLESEHVLVRRLHEAATASMDAASKKRPSAAATLQEPSTQTEWSRSTAKKLRLEPTPPTVAAHSKESVILGKGSFGCVVTEAACPGNRYQGPIASKLFLNKLKTAREDLEIENRAGKVLAEIDPLFKHSVRMIRGCIRRVSQYSKDILTRCNVPEGEFVVQADFPIAGINLLSTLHKDIPMFPLFSSFLELLKFVQRLHREKHMFHYDISLANVLLDDKTKSVRIIDWGLSGATPRDDIMAAGKNLTYPPDTPFFHAARTTRIFPTEDAIRTWFQTYRKIMTAIVTSKALSSALTSKSAEDNFVAQSDRSVFDMYQGMSAAEITQLYYPTIDTYSLGLVAIRLKAISDVPRKFKYHLNMLGIGMAAPLYSQRVTIPSAIDYLDWILHDLPNAPEGRPVPDIAKHFQELVTARISL